MVQLRVSVRCRPKGMDATKTFGSLGWNIVYLQIYHLFIQHNYEKRPIYRWFMMIYVWNKHTLFIATLNIHRVVTCSDIFGGSGSSNDLMIPPTSPFPRSPTNAHPTSATSALRHQTSHVIFFPWQAWIIVEESTEHTVLHQSHEIFTKHICTKSCKGRLNTWMEKFTGDPALKAGWDHKKIIAFPPRDTASKTLLNNSLKSEPVNQDLPAFNHQKDPKSINKWCFTAQNSDNMGHMLVSKWLTPEYLESLLHVYGKIWWWSHVSDQPIAA